MFNAAETYLSMRERYLEMLLDETTGIYPCAGEEEHWNNVREYLRKIWKSDDKKGAIFAQPVAEPLFPYPNCGKKIKELIADGTLHKQMACYVDPNVEMLHRHQ